MNSPRRVRRLLGPLAAASLTLVACGGGESGSAVPPKPDVIVLAPGGLKFDMTNYSAHAGEVAIAYENHDVQTHTMIIEDSGGKKVPGWTRLVVGSQKQEGDTVNLPAGTYKVICDIHEAAGMVATLTIT